MKISLLSFLFIFFSLFLNNAVSQNLIYPLEYDPLRDLSRFKNARITAEGDSVSLPFFDDFSNSQIHPDPDKWLPRGGTYIGNRFAVNPPTPNAATFDGLDYKGRSYGDPGFSGKIDKLVSCPFKFGNFSPKGDSSSSTVYISFFWQTGIPGDKASDTTFFEKDRIELQLKDRDGEWKTLWKHPDDSLSPFELVIKKIPENFLYDGFQFRFQAYGKLTPLDIFHIDYVYMNKGRNLKDIFFKDQSFGKTPDNLLKDYQNIPYNQFSAKKNDLLNDSVTTIINNLHDVFNSNRYIGILKNKTENNIIDTIVDNTIKFNAEVRGKKIGGKINKGKIPSMNKPFTITSEFVITGDADQGYIDFTKNNTIKNNTYFGNFYAYDDGTAEQAFGTNQAGNNIALEFNLFEPDTLKGIGIAFVDIGPNRIGNTFVLKVWKNLKENSSEAFYTKVHNFTYRSKPYVIDNGDTANVFNYYRLEEPIPLKKGKFYAGIQNTIDNILPIGFDINTNSLDKMHLFRFNKWKNMANFDFLDKGSLMIRPYFKDKPKGFVSSLKKHKISANDTKNRLYPNPVNIKLHIKGNFSAIKLQNMNGKVIYSKNFTYNKKLHSINVQQYPEGMYLLGIKAKEWTFHKVMIKE